MIAQHSLDESLQALRKLLDSSAITKTGIWRDKDNGAWNKLWSAFDNIQDTQLAIEQFSSEGASPLGIYGVLQAMVVQQDAIKHLEEVLSLEVTGLASIEGAQEIRNVRDETVGHPTGTRKGKGSSYLNGTISYTSITPNAVNSRELEYIIWRKSGNEIKSVSLDLSIKKQEESLVKILKSIYFKIQDIEQKHRLQFKKDSLAALFSQANYYIQKLWPHEPNREHSQICLKMLKEIFEKFKEGVQNRYGEDLFTEESFKPGLVLEVKKIEKTLPRIEAMILLQEGVDELNLEVYVESLSNSFDELEKMAEEIDAELGSVAS